MLQYMTAKEASIKWNISHRRVSILCMENRIPNVAMLGNMWIIPIDAKKPEDARLARYNKDNNVHPFIKWAGGKSQLLQTLKDRLPENFEETINKYVEPFVGGGALLFSLLQMFNFEKVFISDNNVELMNVYVQIRDNCDILIEKLSEIEIDYGQLDEARREKYYYDKRDEFNKLKLIEENCIEKAVLFIFLNKTCFNGLYRVNKSGAFNVPAGRYKNPLICDRDNLIRVSKMLQNIEIVSGDFESSFDFVDEKTFVYFDPPYRPLNTTSGFTSYTENQFTDKDQIKLADYFKKLDKKGAKLMLSNSDPKNSDENDNFFDELYRGYNIERIEASRMINSKGDKRGKITELLIRNY